MKKAVPIIFLSILLFSSLVIAETKTFIKEYTYQASEADSKLACRVIALEQVKRLLLEELGTYLESHTEIVNFQLRRDQITALTAGIVQTQVIKEKWDGERYWMQAKIEADPDEVVKAVNSLRKDREKSRQFEEANRKAEAALQEVERLRKELDLAKKDQGTIGRYDEAVNGLNAIDWYRKGLSAIRVGNYSEGISANTKAIQLNPQYAMAYVNRGAAYINSGNYQQGITDCNKAIELDSRIAWAYANRGVAYRRLGNYQLAIEDCSRAIELDPRNEWAYVTRGAAYGNLGKYQLALEDSNKAIELDPRDATAYSNRAAAYMGLGKYQLALEDSNKAISLDPKLELAYQIREGALQNLAPRHRCCILP